VGLSKQKKRGGGGEALEWTPIEDEAINDEHAGKKTRSVEAETPGHAKKRGRTG